MTGNYLHWLSATENGGLALAHAALPQLGNMSFRLPSAQVQFGGWKLPQQSEPVATCDVGGGATDTKRAEQEEDETAARALAQRLYEEAVAAGSKRVAAPDYEAAGEGGRTKKRKKHKKDAKKEKKSKSRSKKKHKKHKRRSSSYSSSSSSSGDEIRSGGDSKPGIHDKVDSRLNPDDWFAQRLAKVRATVRAPTHIHSSCCKEATH